MRTKIETGYMIGGKTWISDAWNAGTLTKESVGKGIADWASGIDKTDDEIRAKLRVSEAWVAKEHFENQDQDDAMTYEELLDACVEREFTAMRSELDAKAEVSDALQELYDNWTDDENDEEQFDRVCQTHAALDAYCGKSQGGAQ